MVSRVARFFGLCVLFAVCCLLSTQVRAEVPRLIRYQGQASDANGVPLEGPYSLTFRIYDAETLGTVVWQEAQSNVSISKGHFSVLLGTVSPLNVDWAVPRWLSIQVGTDPELSPRQRITSVPLALRAETAESLAGGGTDISVRVSHSALQSVANETSVILNFDGESYDTNNMHDLVTNNSRLTCKIAGKYLVWASVEWEPSATGRRQMEIVRNGTAVIARDVRGAVSGTGIYHFVVAAPVDLAVNDYVEVSVYQNSGGALRIWTDHDFSPRFGMVKIN